MVHRNKTNRQKNRMSGSRPRRKKKRGPKPGQFKARPAPRGNPQSSFSQLKRIVEMPITAGLTQVEAGYRVRDDVAASEGVV